MSTRSTVVDVTFWKDDGREPGSMLELRGPAGAVHRAYLQGDAKAHMHRVYTDALDAAKLRALNSELVAALEMLVVQKPYRDGDGAAMFHAENIAKAVIARAKGEPS